MLDGANFCSSSRNYSRHPWRSRYAPPSAFAFAVLQTQSRSDIRDPATFASNGLRQRHWVPAFAGMTTGFSRLGRRDIGALLLIVIPESRSDIRDPAPFCNWPKALGSRFRANDDGIFAATPPRYRRLAFDRHPESRSDIRDPAPFCNWPKALGSRFRGNDDGIFAATPPRHRRLAFDRHPGIAERYPGPSAFLQLAEGTGFPLSRE